MIGGMGLTEMLLLLLFLITLLRAEYFSVKDSGGGPGMTASNAGDVLEKTKGVLSESTKEFVTNSANLSISPIRPLNGQQEVGGVFWKTFTPCSRQGEGKAESCRLSPSALISTSVAPQMNSEMKEIWGSSYHFLIRF